MNSSPFSMLRSINFLLLLLFYPRAGERLFGPMHSLAKSQHITEWIRYFKRWTAGSILVSAGSDSHICARRELGFSCLDVTDRHPNNGARHPVAVVFGQIQESP